MNRHWTPGAIVAAVAMALFAWAAPAQAGWSAPVDLTPSVLDQPTVERDGAFSAALPDGGFVYLWNRFNADSSTDLVSRVAYDDGTFGPVNVVAAGYDQGSSAIEPTHPSIATGADGQIRVVWMWQDMFCSPSCDYRGRIATASLGEDGEVLTSDLLYGTLPNTFDSVGIPALSMAADGSVLIAWSFHDTSADTDQVFYAHSEDNDLPVVVGGFDTTDRMMPLEVAAAMGGGGFVAIPYSEPLDRIDGMMVNDAGISSPAVTLSQSDIEVNATGAVIDSRGIGTVVYQAEGADLNQIYARQMDSEADPIGDDPIQISKDDAQSGSLFDRGAVAVTSEDEVLVNFRQAFDESPAYGSYVRTIAEDGSVGPISTVSQNAGTTVYRSYVALAPEGGGTVLLGTAPETGPGRVQARELSADLVPTGTTATLATQLADTELIPNDVVYSDDGVASALITDAQGGFSEYVGLRVSFLETDPPELEIWVQPRTVQGQEIVVGATAEDRSNPVTIDWNFGDGTTASGGYVRHTFASAGSFEVKATATDSAGNEAELSQVVEVISNSAPPPPNPPDTNITGKPGKKVKAKTATFKFVSSQPGSKFECRLDKAGWSDCRSPKKYKKLKPGKHTFKVRAIMGDLIDQTPASYGWAVKKPKKSKKGGSK